MNKKKLIIFATDNNPTEFAMKIDSIEIKGFRLYSEVKISDLDPYLNLLIGVNGAGKSSILDALAIALTAFTARLTTASSRGKSIPIEDIKRGQSMSSIKVVLDNGVEWSKIRTRRLDKDVESDYSQLIEYTKAFRQKLDEGQPVSVPIIVHYGVKRSVTEIPLRFPKSPSASPTEAYKDWIDSKASYRDIFPWIRAEEDYENELIRDNPDVRLRSLEALRRVMEVLLPGYSEIRVRRKPHLEVVVMKQGEELPLSQLSDGEKCYIALACDIVRRLSIANPVSDILLGDGIVMIDEVDLHLHPSWEQTIMEKLHSVFPNLQFIVSAHSPLVASNFNGKIFAMTNGAAKPLPRLYGVDYSTILHDWMATSPQNKEINALIELYRSYRSNGMEPQASAIMQKLFDDYKIDKDAVLYKSALAGYETH